MSNKHSRIPEWVEDWALIVGIVVVMAIFVHYGFSLFYPTPEYNDFCDPREEPMVVATPTESSDQEINTEAECEAEGGQWQEFPEPVEREGVDEGSTTTITGTCDRDFDCRQNYQSAREDHNRNAFLAIVAIGVAVAAVGFSEMTSGVAATALSLGGVLVLLTGVMRFWQMDDNYGQFILLALALGVFLYFAWRREE